MSSHCQASGWAQGTCVCTQVASLVVEEEDKIGDANIEGQVSHGARKEMWQCRGAPHRLKAGVKASQGGPPKPRPEGGLRKGQGASERRLGVELGFIMKSLYTKGRSWIPS